MIRKNVERWHLGCQTEDGEKHTYYPTTYSEDAINRMVDALNAELRKRDLKTELGEKIINYFPVKHDFGPADCF